MEDVAAKFISTQDAAAMLGFSESTFERLAKQEDWLHPRKIGKSVMWSSKDIKVFGHIIDRRQNVQTQTPKKGEARTETEDEEENE